MALTKISPSMIDGLLSDLIDYVPSGAGAVTRSIASKLGDTLSVKDFGAVGDGIADDTVAIQAAVDAAVASGRALWWPRGIYECSGVLSAVSGGQIVMRGNNAMIRNRARTTGGNMFLFDGLKSVDIQGLTFDGNKANVTGSVFGDALLCIRNVISNAQCNVLVHSNTFIDAPYHAIYYINCTGVRITENHCTGCVYDVIFGHSKIYGAVIANNTLKDNPGTGIKVHGLNALEPTVTSSRIVISGNVVDYTGVASFTYGTQTLGIETWGGCFNVAVTGNVVRGHDARTTRIFGISLDNTALAAVTGNVCENYLGIAMEAANSRHLTVTGNTFYDCAYGFSSSGPSSGAGTFVGNIIRACENYGIQLYQVPAPWTIANNTFIDVAATNIFFNAGAPGSLVQGNSFVSENLGSTVLAVHIQAARVKVLNNSMEFQAGMAAGFAITVDASRCRVCGNHASAGAPAATSFIMCAAGGDYLVARGNTTFQYNGATVDSSGAATGFGWITDNYNDLGGDPAIVKTGTGADNTATGNQQFS